MPSRFSLEDARAICLAPFLERETRAEEIRRAADEAEASRARGVSWSGLAPTTPVVRSPDEIHREAGAAHMRAMTYAAGPRGRFLAALSELERQGIERETATARAAYARGFADPDAPACPAEIGCALAVLARQAQPAARDACLALAELLGAALGLAAE
jgi:hypothetical protein